jgi:hypothetical protein
MASLLDLLQGGQLPQPQGEMPDPWAQLEEIRKRQELLAQQPVENALKGSVSTEPRAESEMIPTREVVSRPPAGQPYAPPPGFTPNGDAPAPDRAAPQVAQKPDNRPPANPASALAATLSQGTGVIPDLVKMFTSGQRETSTVRVLMDKLNIDQETATLLSRNPTVMQQILTQQFGGAKRQFGLNPIYGLDKDGNLTIGQLHSGGGMQAVQAPAGWRPAEGIKTTDYGTGIVTHGAKSGRPGDVIAKDTEEESRRKKLGTERGEEQGAINKDKAALDSSVSGLNRLAAAANEVLKHPGLPGNFGWQSYAPNFPGGDSANANAKLITLKAQVGFSVLQAMRDASKTGGALGSITEGEHKLLQNALVALDGAQNVEQVQGELTKLLAFVEESKGRLHAAYNRAHGNAPAQAPAATGDGWKDLGNGVRIRERR